MWIPIGSGKFIYLLRFLFYADCEPSLHAKQGSGQIQANCPMVLQRQT